MSSAELRENRTLGRSASGDGRKGENNPKQFLKTLSPMGTISDAKDRGLRLRGGTKTVGDLMNESSDLLRSHFGLTPSEARLALHLVTGETLRSAAAKLHISYETARTQLKRIFSKTGTCRQAEVVVVIVTAFPACLEAAPQAQTA